MTGQPAPAALVDALVCPYTRQTVVQAPLDLVADINARIARGQVASLDGTPVTVPIDDALLREDSALAFPLRDGIVSVTASDAIRCR